MSSGVIPVGLFQWGIPVWLFQSGLSSGVMSSGVMSSGVIPVEYSSVVIPVGLYPVGFFQWGYIQWQWGYVQWQWSFSSGVMSSGSRVFPVCSCPVRLSLVGFSSGFIYSGVRYNGVLSIYHWDIFMYVYLCLHSRKLWLWQSWFSQGTGPQIMGWWVRFWFVSGIFGITHHSFPKIHWPNLVIPIFTKEAYKTLTCFVIVIIVLLYFPLLAYHICI